MISKKRWERICVDLTSAIDKNLKSDPIHGHDKALLSTVEKNNLLIASVNAIDGRVQVVLFDGSETSYHIIVAYPTPDMKRFVAHVVEFPYVITKKKIQKLLN